MICNRVPDAGLLPVARFAETVYWPSRLRQRRPDALLRTCRHFDCWSKCTPIRDLSDELVTGWLRSLLATDRPATINTKRARILTVWRCAWRKRVCVEPPRDVPRVREPHDPPVAKTICEMSALLRTCQMLPGAVCGIENPDYWSSLLLALYATGERFSAVCSCEWSQFSATAKTLRVAAGSTKTGAGRVYHLTEQAAAAIELIRTPLRSMIWPWPHCTRYRWTVLRRIFEAAGLECTGDRSLAHSIRRATLSYTAAVDLDLARRQAGHFSVATTLAHYIDPRIADIRQAADVLPRIDC